MFIYKTPGTGPMPHAIDAFGRHQDFLFFWFSSNKPLDFINDGMKLIFSFHLLILIWFQGTAIDTPHWRNCNKCWPWSPARPANRLGTADQRPPVRKNCIRAVVCCLVRRNVLGIELNRKRTCPALAVCRPYTQLFWVSRRFDWKSNNRWPAEGH